MSDSKIHFHPPGKLVALVGNPNCGKTALFNRLTGGKQHVANYAGVTVERKEGKLTLPDQKSVRLLDLPGTYSLYPRTPDERVTCDVLRGAAKGERVPDLLVCVIDATNLRMSLRFVLSIKRTGIPTVVALNMMDEAKAKGIEIDVYTLSRELGLAVIPTVAVKRGGEQLLKEYLENLFTSTLPSSSQELADQNISANTNTNSDSNGSSTLPLDADPSVSLAGREIVEQLEADHVRVQNILKKLGLDQIVYHTSSDRLDSVLLHPLLGPLILVVLLFAVFQAMFTWSAYPMDLLKDLNEYLKMQIISVLPDTWLTSLIVDGVLSGAFGVITFLPQILVLFLFILVLEESGYLPRAAYLLDRLMGTVGLSGRSFIPLLSSFACAIPGIMAMRTIPNMRDRFVTMLIAPLMTCSARLPVYSLLIGAFIPQKTVGGYFELQGLVMFALYLAGIFAALLVAWALKKLSSSARVSRPLMMELPRYRWPNPWNVFIGLLQRAGIFIKRVGGNILLLTVLIWFLASFPRTGAVGVDSAVNIEQTFAGILGGYLSLLLGSIGFNWQICISLIPGMVAREVVISSLGTVYALTAVGEDGLSQALSPIISQQWSLATALSLLTWFIFAPQCLSTLAVLKRESGGWRIPLISVTYLFTLAYLASYVVYHLSNYYLSN
jgi:ferrous iron transport protein B